MSAGWCLLSVYRPDSYVSTWKAGRVLATKTAQLDSSNRSHVADRAPATVQRCFCGARAPAVDPPRMFLVCSVRV